MASFNEIFGAVLFDPNRRFMSQQFSFGKQEAKIIYFVVLKCISTYISTIPRHKFATKIVKVHF